MVTCSIVCANDRPFPVFVFLRQIDDSHILGSSAAFGGQTCVFQKAYRDAEKRARSSFGDSGVCNWWIEVLPEMIDNEIPTRLRLQSFGPKRAAFHLEF
jgi:hypothetical protein